MSTFTRAAEARRVVDLILNQLERMRSSPPDPNELRDAKALAVGRFALGLETSDAVMEALVDLDLYGLSDDSLDTYRTRVRAVSPAQTASMAMDLLHPQRAAIVVVGPAAQIAPTLKDLGSVEVVTP